MKVFPIHRLAPTRIVRLASAAIIAVLAIPAVASAACPAQPASQIFKQFGDNAHYSLLSGAHFETNASGWTLNRASVVSGNEPWKVRSAGDAKSLQISGGGTATSPWFCVGVEHPTFRFFVKQSGSSMAMYYRLRWIDSSGSTRTTLLGALTSTGGSLPWQPTSELMLAQGLPIWGSQTVQAQLIFEPFSGSGSWTIDDVYIDPYTRG